MFEQQLQVSGPQLSKESEINWSRIQNLYHQTAKTINPPEPHQSHESHNNPSHYTQQDLETILTEVFKDIAVTNNHQLQLLQQKFNAQIDHLHQRICRLENQLDERKSCKQANTIRSEGGKGKYQTPMGKSQAKNEEIQTTEAKTKPTKSFIYIQQNEDNDISLLDQLQPSQPEITPMHSARSAQTRHNNHRDSRFKTQVETHQPAGASMRDILFEQRIGRVTCNFHESQLRNLQQNIQEMKRHMQKAYKIEFRPLPWVQGVRQDLSQANPLKKERVIINSSKNSEQHLINENLALRDVNERYKSELQKAQRQVNLIRRILNEGLDYMIPVQVS